MFWCICFLGLTAFLSSSRTQLCSYSDGMRSFFHFFLSIHQAKHIGRLLSACFLLFLILDDILRHVMKIYYPGTRSNRIDTYHRTGLWEAKRTALDVGKFSVGNFSGFIFLALSMSGISTCIYIYLYSRPILRVSTDLMENQFCVLFLFFVDGRCSKKRGPCSHFRAPAFWCD